MSVNKKRLLLAIAFLVLLALASFTFLAGDGNAYNYVDIAGERIAVEIADTDLERQRGLMFRDSLCHSCGMLFVFWEEDFRSFGMKNTLIPLDMVFINANLTVIDVLHAVPCAAEPCQTYTPKSKALYVLEVNGGRFDEKIIGQKAGISTS